ncbi:MAG: Argininosuccinate synthase [Candidatus Yanofskybacteria bacterium GW2011_GWA1_48_10]|uniref:argininosuccinate synthase n=2 Tax=Patescibacteria group TaxID=1783273 RepID=A0A0G1U5R4_9BACT|nr:MAG: Argininosuccinate synthase [Candidatus Gottesmanbacteria bacterium GW2011_GWA2_47_9]KKU89399.1 MAG: Argininosuccinate synthase [Candidatus Yanofskybacteria bacterium GW2011_GWA1_48_10]
MYKQPVLSKEKENNAKQGKTCLLLYSGGVDTSVSVYLLKHYYGYTVYTFSVDICQDAIWAHNMAKKALTIGASKAYVYDGKKEFADTYLSQVIKSNGYYDDYYPIGTSIARPWQAKLGIDIAKKLHVDAIAHGNKGRGAGAFQFNMVLNFFAPKNLKLEAPITDWWPTRRDEVAFAKDHGIPLPVDADNPFSYDDNIMSNAINYGDIDDIGKSVPEKAYTWTVPVEHAPDAPDYTELTFQNGLPVKLNGKIISLAELFLSLNTLGGKHGIGRVDMLENGLYGNKFKWVYELPAATAILYAHKELEKLVLPKETLWFKHTVIDQKWAKLVYHAQVYSPLAKSLMSFIDATQQYVNGTIALKLFKGMVTVVKRSAEASLVNIDASSLTFREGMDMVPYGFEEYSFASKHSEVFANYLGVAGAGIKEYV